MIKIRLPVLMALAGLLHAPGALAQDSASDLAQELANPVANLISFPIQSNFDFGQGYDDDGFRMTTNVQPVIPIKLNEDWNLISRTILPVIYQEDVTGPNESQFGIGDVVQSAFFSPSKIGDSGVVWGAGPAILVPTASKSAFQSKKLGVGPTLVVLKQSKGLTFGALVNHIWSVAGSDSRPDISTTFMQPFVSYTTPSATTYGVVTETSYDWERKSWLVPIILNVSQLTTIGKQPVSFGLGAKYYVESPQGGPNWGLRLTVAFLFPKK